MHGFALFVGGAAAGAVAATVFNKAIVTELKSIKMQLGNLVDRLESAVKRIEAKF